MFGILCMVLNITTLAFGTFLLTKSRFLQLIGLWIVNTSLFILTAEKGINLHASLLYLTIGLYAICRYIGEQRITNGMIVLFALCGLEVLTSYILVFNGQFELFNGLTFLKKNIVLVLFLPTVIYLFNILRHSKRKLKEHCSLDNFELYDWIFGLLNISIKIYIIGAIFTVLEMYSHDFNVSYEYVFLVFIFANFYLIYAVCFKSNEASMLFDLTKESIQINTEVLQQDKLSMDLFNKINKDIDERRLFAISKLTLSSLALQLEIEPKQLSQMIHNHAKTNFHDYINVKRINLLKELLIDPKYQHYTLVGIGEEVGYTAKSTFYGIFKKYTGLTPRQYIKAHGPASSAYDVVNMV